MYHEVGRRAVIILLQFWVSLWESSNDLTMPRAKSNGSATFWDLAKSVCHRCSPVEHPVAYVRIWRVLTAHTAFTFRERYPSL